MKKNLISFVGFALVFMAHGAAGAAPLSAEWQKKTESEIQKIISRSKIPAKSLGMVVGWPGQDNQEIFSLNPNESFIPASISKLVTAAATLEAFPPGTKLKTSLLTDAVQEGSRLKGSLYLKGGGDPGFVSETMWFLVNAFLRTGIKQIDGDLIVDDHLFDQVRFDSSRQDERVDRAYDAPTGAMSFNWNSVNIFIRAGSKAGEPADVFLDPENDYVVLQGKITTGARGSGNSTIAERTKDSRKDREVIRVSGKIAAGSPEQVVFKNIAQPDFWAGANLKSFLAQRGIKVMGSVKTGVTPSAARMVAEAESKPIEAMLTDMNKFSNNFVAEMLVKNIAVQRQKLGTISEGMKSLNDYLKKLGLPASSYHIVNPSGLTRENQITPKAMLAVVQDLQRQFQFQPEFVSSLPIAGIDGTLKKRMKGTAGERWIRGKTGYLTNVVALAGYAGRRDGNVIPFVFIFNGTADEGSVRKLFDETALQLID